MRIFIPDYKFLQYRYNPETGRYQKQPSKFAFQKMPFDLKIEQTRAQHIAGQGAEMIVTGRFVNKKREFFSGLRRTNSPNWFHGNDYEIVQGKKKMSLVVFRISNNDEFLNVYYFNRFYKESPQERAHLVNSFIQFVNNQRGEE